MIKVKKCVFSFDRDKDSMTEHVHMGCAESDLELPVAGARLVVQGQKGNVIS